MSGYRSDVAYTGPRDGAGCAVFIVALLLRALLTWVGVLVISAVCKWVTGEFPEGPLLFVLHLLVWSWSSVEIKATRRDR